MIAVDDQRFNYIYFLRQPVEMYPVVDSDPSPDRLFITIEQLSTQDDQLLGWVPARVIDRHTMMQLYPKFKATDHMWWILDTHDVLPDSVLHHVLLGVRDDGQTIYE